MQFFKQCQELIDRQYSNPTGLLGMYFGEKMVRQHRLETLWTIELLKLQHDESILELGSGAGYAVKLLLERPNVSKVVGLDISPSVLRVATMRNRKELRKRRVKLVQGNVNYLPFQAESFSRVFSIHSIYFWDNIPKTILEIYRVLKPEGITVLTLSDGRNNETSNDIKDMLEQQIIPSMNGSGYKNIEIIRGPNSRGYHTLSIKAQK